MEQYGGEAPPDIIAWAAPRYTGCLSAGLLPDPIWQLQRQLPCPILCSLPANDSDVPDLSSQSSKDL